MSRKKHRKGASIPFAAGVPTKGDGLICDFCSSPNIQWSYPAKSFDIPPIVIEGPSGRKEIKDGSKGDWAACEVCHTLIENEQWKHLQKRSVQTFIQRWGRWTPQLTRRLELLQTNFRKHRTGPPVKLEVGPARGMQKVAEIPTTKLETVKGDMTPVMAANLRQALMLDLERSRVITPVGSVTPNFANEFYTALDRSRVVLWDNSIWLAAITGAESFDLSDLDKDLFAEQLWVWKKPVLLADNAEAGWGLKGHDRETGKEVDPMGMVALHIEVMQAKICATVVTWTKDDQFAVVPYKFDLEQQKEWETEFEVQFGVSDPKTQAVQPWYKTVMAALAFLDLPFVGLEERQAMSRQERRQRERQDQSVLPPINVVYLRARNGRASHVEAADGSSREYTCRWMVQPHWRRQWYPGLKQHKPKYILSYMKGPDNMPFRAPRPTVALAVR